MVPNPCCCELQLGTKIVAVVNIVLDVLALIFCIYGVVLLAGFLNIWYYDETMVILNITVIIILFLVVVAHLYLSWLLYVGAKNRDISRCRAWLIVTVAYLILYICSSLYNYSIMSAVIVSSLIQLYQIWVVYAFMEEVKNQGLPHTQSHVHVVHTYPPPQAYQPQPPMYQPPYTAGPSAMPMPPQPQQMYGPTDPYGAPAYGHHNKL